MSHLFLNVFHSNAYNLLRTCHHIYIYAVCETSGFMQPSSCDGPFASFSTAGTFYTHTPYT